MRVFVKYSKGTRAFMCVGDALEFANDIRKKYKEEPFIYDEY